MFFHRLLLKIKSIFQIYNPVNRWHSPQGYKEVLQLCLPLIASFTASSALMFVDRLFLSNYSVDAIAASLPAGVAKLTVSTVFIGIASYTGVFTAQYIGAAQPHRAAVALWQGLYFSLVTGLISMFLIMVSPFIFNLANHGETVMKLELDYFNVLILGSPVELFMVTMSSFMAALGRTKIVMWVTLAGLILNIPLDYLLIFGLSINGINIIPELGVLGAAIATVFSWLFSTVIFGFLIFNKKMEKTHGIMSARYLDFPLIKRLIKYGYPGGLQFFLEISVFTFFTFSAGRLDKLTLACNNIVFSIEALSFFPMIGVGQAISIMVGQAVGRLNPEEGARATKSGIIISSSYVFMMMMVFLFFPKSLLGLFLPDSYDLATKEYLLSLGTTLLKFVVAYSIFDGLYLCCFGACKGAGDVQFPMLAMGFWGIFGLVLPILVLFYFDLATIYSLWGCMVFYILGLTASGVWRFKSRIWMKKRVIELADNTV